MENNKPSEEIMYNGRRFLIGLGLLAEQQLSDTICASPSELVLNLKHWQMMVAFILNKLCASFEGASDLNFGANYIFVNDYETRLGQERKEI